MINHGRQSKEYISLDFIFSILLYVVTLIKFYRYLDFEVLERVRESH